MCTVFLFEEGNHYAFKELEITTNFGSSMLHFTSARAFVLHFLEMLVAMIIGMVILDEVAYLIFSAFAGIDLFATPILFAPVMTINMVIGMVLWMLYRRHSLRDVGEMSGAMVLPLCVLIGPHWIGMLPGSALVGGSMILSLPAMLLVMLYRRDVYATSHHMNHEHQHLSSVGGR